MDQTRFDVLQTTLQVVSELGMAPAQRLTRGNQFTVSFYVLMDSGMSVPYDIYVDRLAADNNGVGYTGKATGTMILEATASIVPDGERFSIELVLHRSKDLSEVRPELWAGEEMFRQIRASLDQQFTTEIVKILPGDTDQTT
jgi:hypothetical protein